MLDELLPFYERELTYLRQMSKEFAAQYPKIASRLLIDGDTCEDPHVERLIEAFAFLAARIHKKLDDEFPEITDAFLGVVFPHLLRPVPSFSIAEFQIDAQDAQITERYEIERHTQLYSRAKANGLQCRFRTCYPVDLWPVRVVGAHAEAIQRSPFSSFSDEAVGVIRIRLQTVGAVSLSELGLDRLRFFIDSEPAYVHALYELLLNSPAKIVLSSGTGPRATRIELDADCIRPVGFEADEGIIDYDARSFVGYRLLHEYFAFPEKFFFFDLVGLDVLARGGFDKEFEVAILLNEHERSDRLARLALIVVADTFRLGCTPVVNLFKQRAEPIRITHEKNEYDVVPDVRRPRGMEVYSIDEVRKSTRSDEKESVVQYHPFYSYRHGATPESERTFWYATRRNSPLADDDGTDVSITLVDLDFDPSVPAVETLGLSLTCTNRDLPAQLPFGGDQGEFEMEGSPAVSRIRALRKPTAALRPALHKAGIWRLISHLSLNHLSLVTEGREALLEILDLYNFSSSPAVRAQISGIVGLTSSRTIAFVGPPERAAFVRGTGIVIEFDETAYVGSGVYLFARVLDNFFGLYCAVNSFTQLTVRTKQREKELVAWPARTGEAILL